MQLKLMEHCGHGDNEYGIKCGLNGKMIWNPIIDSSPTQIGTDTDWDVSSLGGGFPQQLRYKNVPK